MDGCGDHGNGGSDQNSILLEHWDGRTREEQDNLRFYASRRGRSAVPKED